MDIKKKEEEKSGRRKEKRKPRKSNGGKDEATEAGVERERKNGVQAEEAPEEGETRKEKEQREKEQQEQDRNTKTSNPSIKLCPLLVTANVPTHRSANNTIPAQDPHVNTDQYHRCVFSSQDDYSVDFVCFLTKNIQQNVTQLMLTTLNHITVLPAALPNGDPSGSLLR